MYVLIGGFISIVTIAHGFYTGFKHEKKRLGVR